ncbi:aminotransferase class IV [Candidatus Kaiserbacteria bacterium]|nr:aminotransferase class IV [Candidatus Kaiserbacteria bacterium]
MKEQLCWLNGNVVPLKEAKIGVLDLGVLRGFGIYEGITAFRGEPFHFDAHWERFERSAKPLGLTLPYSSGEVLEAMRELIKRNTDGSPSTKSNLVLGERANIRMILTGGEAEGGIEHVPGRETLYITAEEFAPLPEVLYERGGHLIQHDHLRFMPEAKTIGYITAVTLQDKRKADGAVEILYTSGERVLECATSNIFIVKDSAVITPDAGVLKGITRNVTIELARGAYQVEERPVMLAELFAADEAFITSSFKDIVPIVSIGAHTIGSGEPGAVTRDLMARFAAHTQSQPAV